MSDRIVIFGAGALSLGFMGPELGADYRMTFLDTAAKADFVGHVQKAHQYVTNLAGQQVKPLTVQDVDAFRLDLPEQDAAIRQHIAQARIFFTAVGIRNLDSALGYLHQRLAGRTDGIYILCAENGENVAEAWRGKLPPNIRLCDTVMGRMCRLEERAEAPYASVAEGIPWGVVGEDLYRIPISKSHEDAEVFHSAGFHFVPEEEFHARERVKLYAHNGLHFYVAAIGRLHGVERFSDLIGHAAARTAVRELLEQEIAPALWNDCAWRIGRKEFDAYIARLPDRLFSPTLADHIARGLRGLEEKFAPNERILGGLRLLLANGVKPNRFYDLIAAGLEVCKRDRSPEVATRILRSLPGADVQAEVEARWRRMT